MHGSRIYEYTANSIEYSDCFDIVKDATYVLDKMNYYTREKAPIDEVAKMFSEYLAELWKVHPYREGNTRTVITFCSQFSLERHEHGERDVGLYLLQNEESK